MEKKYFNKEDVISIGNMIRDNKELSVEEIINLYEDKLKAIRKAKMWLGRQKYYHRDDISPLALMIINSLINMVENNPNCISEKNNTLYIRMGEVEDKLTTVCYSLIQNMSEEINNRMKNKI